MDRAALKRWRSGAAAERGAAVVLAMVLAALAAAVAVTVFADQQRWSGTVLHRRDQAQAQALALAGVQWARQIVYQDTRALTTHLGQPWAVTLPPIPLENGEIRGAIADAQARLNVNALGEGGTAAALARVRLERLLAQRGIDPRVLDAIADWVDSDDATRGGGAEDAHYAAQSPPSLAANAPIVRTAELSDVRGVRGGMLAAIAPFVAALPRDAPVNLNTAPAEVLAAIVDDANSAALATIVADRARKPYTTVAEFRARLPQGVRLASEDRLAVKSDHFVVTIEARQGDTLARVRALLRRADNGWPAVVWQVAE
jgi:general secretion pathway protein K